MCGEILAPQDPTQYKHWICLGVVCWREVCGGYVVELGYGKRRHGCREICVSVMFDTSRCQSLGHTYWFVSWRRFVSAKRPGACIWPLTSASFVLALVFLSLQLGHFVGIEKCWVDCLYSCVSEGYAPREKRQQDANNSGNPGARYLKLDDQKLLKTFGLNFFCISKP